MNNPLVNRFFDRYAPQWIAPRYHKIDKTQGTPYNKDCQIRSICNLTNAHYQDVYKLMYDGGWREDKTTIWEWEDNMECVLFQLGYMMRKVSAYEVYWNGTLNRAYNLLIYMSGKKPRTPNGEITAHITAAINGVVFDHIDSRTHRYNWESFYEVITVKEYFDEI